MGKRVCALFCTLCIFFSLAGSALVTVASASQLDGVNLSVQVDGKKAVTVKAYQSSYPGNLLISLRDLASALRDTSRAFHVATNADEDGVYRILIRHDKAYSPTENDNKPLVDLEVTDCIYDGISNHKLFLDDQEMKIPTYWKLNEEKIPTDFYMRTVDLGMYLNLSLVFGEGNTVTIDTSAGYGYDLPTMEQAGYFDDLHGIVLGDAETGVVLYGANETQPTQIASTTKLMTYLLVKEAMDAGAFSEDSEYTVSNAVYRLANSEDGLYRQKGRYGCLNLGAKVTVYDLLNAMLVVSANEAALALAEMVSGTEEAFVEQMNRRAAELGMTEAVFYNPHGLPSYVSGQTPVKRQNEMTAEDMFRLSAYLLRSHGTHLTGITTQKRVELPSFGLTNEQATAYARTTNALLYNFSDCLGLKTGTTVRSGANLVAARPVTDNSGDTHRLVAVVFGAEDDFERCEKAAWLLNYAQAHFASNAFPAEAQQAEVPETLPPETQPEVITLPPKPETIPPTEPIAPQSGGVSVGSLVVFLVFSFLGGSLFTVVVVILVRKPNKKSNGKYASH